MEFKNPRTVNPFYQHHSLTPLFQNFRKRKSKEMGRDIIIFISQASSRMCEHLPSQQQLSLTRFSEWHPAAALERSGTAHRKSKTDNDRLALLKQEFMTPRHLNQ